MKTPWDKCLLGNLLHILQTLWKQTQYLIIAEILTVEVPFCSWVHHLGMFSSGVIMLLIFNAVFLQGFLSVISKTESLVLTSHRPILFPFCVWMLPYRSISCPETLKTTRAAVREWNMLLKRSASAVGFLKTSLTEKRNYIPVIPGNLQDRTFFLRNAQIKTASVIFLTSLWVQYSDPRSAHGLRAARRPSQLPE